MFTIHNIANEVFDMLDDPECGYSFEGSHDIKTPRALVNEILNQVPLENKSILALFNVEWVVSAVYENNVNPENITFYSDHPMKSEFIQALGARVINNFMDIKQKFDIVVGNPPFNSSPSGAKRATAGDTRLYQRFYYIAKEHVKAGGIYAMITPKGIIKTLKSDPDFNTKKLNLMTGVDYWQFNTCYWIGINEPNLHQMVVTDTAVSKVFVLDEPDNFHMFNGRIDESKLNSTVSNAVTAVVRLPSAAQSIATSVVDPKWSRVVHGPKFCATILENRKSYTVTDMPVAASHAITITTPTLEEANKLKLFIENNKVLGQLHRKLKTKGLVVTMRHLKPFDLNQIITGAEIPAEWNLTEEDLQSLGCDR